VRAPGPGVLPSHLAAKASEHAGRRERSFIDWVVGIRDRRQHDIGAASKAAQQPAGPPPMTSTSAASGSFMTNGTYLVHLVYLINILI
jgi:hypothetical protein